MASKTKNPPSAQATARAALGAANKEQKREAKANIGFVINHNPEAARCFSDLERTIGAIKFLAKESGKRDAQFREDGRAEMAMWAPVSKAGNEADCPEVIIRLPPDAPPDSLAALVAAGLSRKRGGGVIEFRGVADLSSIDNIVAVAGGQVVVIPQLALSSDPAQADQPSGAPGESHEAERQSRRPDQREGDGKLDEAADNLNGDERSPPASAARADSERVMTASEPLGSANDQVRGSDDRAAQLECDGVSSPLSKELGSPEASDPLRPNSVSDSTRLQQPAAVQDATRGLTNGVPGVPGRARDPGHPPFGARRPLHMPSLEPTGRPLDKALARIENLPPIRDVPER